MLLDSRGARVCFRFVAIGSNRANLTITTSSINPRVSGAGMESSLKFGEVHGERDRPGH